MNNQVIKNAKAESMETRRKTKVLLVIQIIFMASGSSQLLLADSYYVPYLIIAILGFLCLSRNIKNIPCEDACYSRPSIKWLRIGFSLLFACMITLANYKLWSMNSVDGVLVLVAVSFGSFFAFNNILLWIFENINTVVWTEKKFRIRWGFSLLHLELLSASTCWFFSYAHTLETLLETV